MSAKACFIFALSGLLFSITAYADVRVEGLQQPAWLERENQRSSLYPGQTLQAGDRVSTGAQGKLILRLVESSQVKLGANADFTIDSLSGDTHSTLLNGFLRVARGAFRFTSAKLQRAWKRELNIQVGTATIGIRGTDVWGKSTDNKDFVVLLEGSIEIQRMGEPVVQMQEALTIYNAPRNAAAEPIAPVDQQALQQWALETELDQGRGVLHEQGRYRVYLASVRSQSAAQTYLHTLQQAGYAATMFEHSGAQGAWYRVGINGFSAYADAQWFVTEARDTLNVQDAWIVKMQP